MNDNGLENNVSSKEQTVTATQLNQLLEIVLTGYEKSDQDVTFDPVQFEKGNTIDSVKARVAAKTIRETVKAGELIIAVEANFTGPIFDVRECSLLDSQENPEENRFIGAFFPGNFFSRCKASGTDPKKVVQDAIAKIIRVDAQIEAAKHPRAKLPIFPSTLVVQTPPTLPRIFERNAPTQKNRP